MNNKIPRHELAFDIDGVIADTFRTFVEIAQNGYGVSVQYEDIKEYDFMTVVENMDEAIGNRIIEKLVVDPLGAGVQPVEGSVPVLKRFLDYGPLLLVTARAEKEGILKWIQVHFQLKDMASVRIIAAGTHKEKLPILLDYGVKYFVEDRLETCFLLHDASIIPIVFQQPWNQKAHPFKTVNNWNEMEALIEWTD